MKNECETFSFDDSSFPSLLKEIPNPPKKIFVSGILPNNSDAEIKISIVGTRKATPAGKILAKTFASELSRLGIIIVSGLAMGIDTSAHEGVVEAQGKTLAVLANGLDKIYPAQNTNLAQKIILNRGALLSEYPLGTPSYPNQFLERNRIISGLSIATIVIEAPDRSGSLATARFALEQGREVLVVPGPANHPNYIGSHKLIRDGARLITSVENILEDLSIGALSPQPLNSRQSLPFNQELENEEKTIYEVISASGQTLNIDKIAQLSKLNPQTVNQRLAFLTIKGIVKESDGKYTI